MSGIIAVYGLVVSVLITGSRACIFPFYPSVRTNRRFCSCGVSPRVDYPLFAGFVHLGAGLACGFTGLAAGYAIGYVGDSVSHRVQSIPRSPLKAYHGFLLVCESIRV